jgi:hypothetical protein
MAEQLATDYLYESRRAEAECKFAWGLIHWQQSLNDAADAVIGTMPDPLTSAKKAMAAAWRGELPKPPPADPSVPAVLAVGLRMLCEEFLKAEAVAYLGLLRRNGVPQSQCLAQAEQHSLIVVEDVRERKWAYAIDHATDLFDTTLLRGYWTNVERAMRDFFRSDLDLEIWFPDSESNAEAAARDVNIEAEAKVPSPLDVPIDPRQVQIGRATARQAWMNQQHAGWSLVEWQACTKLNDNPLDYKTLKKYWDGITTTRTGYVRERLARVEKVEFSTVPE